MRVFPKKYSIFCGENTFHEVVLIFKNLIRLLAHQKPLRAREDFEKEIERVCRHQKVWTYSTARMGLYVALEAMGLKKGDEVILPAFTCVVVPNAILYAGLKPVYADIQATTFNSHLENYKRKVSGKTKVIYIQHTFGISSGNEAVFRWAKENGFYVIEDCAHAFGGDSSNTGIGQMGDVTIYSLDHSKLLNVCLGGVIGSSNQKLIESIELKHQNIPELPLITTVHILLLFVWEYFMYHPLLFTFMRIPRAILARLGFLQVFRSELITEKEKLDKQPSKLSGYLAVLGISQLSKLEENRRHRTEIVNYLAKRFNIKAYEGKPLLRFSFLVRNREKAEKIFKKKFELGIWFTSIFQGRNSNFEAVGYQAGSCPNAEHTARHIFNFPTHARLTVEDYRDPKVDKKIELLKREIISSGLEFG